MALRLGRLSIDDSLDSTGATAGDAPQAISLPFDNMGVALTLSPSPLGAGVPPTTENPPPNASNDANAVIVTSATGFTINLLYDAAALAAPASFRAGIQTAADMLAAAITDKITVNIKIDYSGTGGGAFAGPDAG